METLRNSWALTKACWYVLRADKELLLFPVFSMIGSLIVVLGMGYPVLLAIRGPAPIEGQLLIPDAAPPSPDWWLLATMVLMVGFVTAFFNAALVSATLERLKGGDPTIASGIGGAWERLWNVLRWSVVSTVAHFTIRALTERLGWWARYAAETGWSVVSFLVLPVIIVEDAGPAKALRRSGSLLRKTWGTNVTIHVGLNAVALATVLPVALCPLCAIAALNSIGMTETAFFSLLGVSMVWLLFSRVVLSALTGVFRAALYCYAVDGQIPSGYFNNGETLKTAFQKKPAKKPTRGFFS